MARPKVSRAFAFAHRNQPALVKELGRANFHLNDNNNWFYWKANGPRQAPGTWGVHFAPNDATPEMLVFSIAGNDDTPFGISYGVTLYGESRSVCYWSSREEDAEIIGEDLEWPGLSAAVLKARMLRMKHEGDTNGQI